MSAEMLVRNSARILLINQEKELCLMCADDPRIVSSDGVRGGRFWFTVGGEIDSGEGLEDAAIREIKEETGLDPGDIELGPEVWFGEYESSFSGKLTRFKQRFIVAHTSKREITTDYFTPEEREVIKEIGWFSLDDILNLNEVVYPASLGDYLPDILEGKYPSRPTWIDLALDPGVKFG